MLAHPKPYMRSLTLAAVAGGACALLATACGSSSLRRFPLAEPMWQDPDRKPFAPKPEEYWSPLVWDGLDKSVFRPIDETLAFERSFESVNVNALDEVPDSSWFENRLGRVLLSRDDMRDGPCKGVAPVTADVPWKVVSAKPNGANPGFVFELPDGRKYLAKFEKMQLERGSSADVVGARLYWAAGFHTPCNEIVEMRPTILRIDPKATVKEKGETVPLEQHHLDDIFRVVPSVGDDRYRAATSLLLEGDPLGPWRYHDVREDDPNDVVPHEDRRELRASRLLAAWINHHDAREQNTLSTWVTGEDGKLGFVRHAMIDFGDSLGGLWEWDVLSRRTGFQYYFDVGHVARDFVTLGIGRRPWDDVAFGPAGEVLGYFDVRLFEPEDWKGGYPNPAFTRMTERDGAWMARIVAHVDDDAIDAMVDAAKIRSEITDRELRRILKGRRDKILRRYLGRLSPLAKPELKTALGSGEPRLCLADLLARAGLVAFADRKYVVRAFVGDGLAEVDAGPPTTPGAPWVCAPLPAVPGASKDSPRYVIVDVIGVSPGFDRRAPARVHLYHLGGADYRVVGLERPETDARPIP